MSSKILYIVQNNISLAESIKSSSCILFTSCSNFTDVMASYETMKKKQLVVFEQDTNIQTQNGEVVIF